MTAEAATAPSWVQDLTDLFRACMPAGFELESAGSERHSAYEWVARRDRSDGSRTVVLAATPLGDAADPRAEQGGLIVEVWWGLLPPAGAASRSLVADIGWGQDADPPLPAADLGRTIEAFLSRAFALARSPGAPNGSEQDEGEQTPPEGGRAPFTVAREEAQPDTALTTARGKAQGDLDITSVWRTVRQALRAEVTESTFHIWIEPLEPAGIVENTLYVRAPAHIRGWVEERFLTALRRAGRTAGFDHVHIVDFEWRPERETEQQETAPSGVAAGLNPRYTFDGFIVSDANRLAHAAAVAVAEVPGEAYNPLFIHGQTGLGKTHLLHAIGNYVHVHAHELKVRYTTVDAFTNDFVAAVRAGAMTSFRERFRDVDVLLVDDVQFLGEKPRTEEEFFHTFNALYEAGSQLIVTSDRPPSDIPGLAPQLRERLVHGLVAELEVPDFEARMAILRKRATIDAVTGVGDDTLGVIARHVTRSIRQLEGALIRVVAYASLRGEKPTPAIATRVLHTLYPKGRPTVEEVQLATAKALSTTIEDLSGENEAPHVTFARAVAIYLACELTEEPLAAIAAAFGNRDDATIAAARERIADTLDVDVDVVVAVEYVRAVLDEQAPGNPAASMSPS